MTQAVQIAGAVLILVGFVLAQVRVLTPQHLWYLVVNVLGAAALAVTAYVEGQWGFVLLEGIWTLVSLAGLVAWVRGRGLQQAS